MEERRSSVDWKEYTDLLVNSYWKKTELRADLGDKALELARVELMARLDGLNHIKEQTKELQHNMISRTEYTFAHQALTEKLDDGVNRLNKLETQLQTVSETKSMTSKNISNWISWIVSGIVIFTFIITYILTGR